MCKAMLAFFGERAVSRKHREEGERGNSMMVMILAETSKATAAGLSTHAWDPAAIRNSLCRVRAMFCRCFRGAGRSRPATRVAQRPGPYGISAECDGSLIIVHLLGSDLAGHGIMLCDVVQGHDQAFVVSGEHPCATWASRQGHNTIQLISSFPESSLLESSVICQWSKRLCRRQGSARRRRHRWRNSSVKW